jgi:lipopolysaccharide transport system ATP-binding protein
METVISIKEIGKKYKITHKERGYTALRDVLGQILFKPFSYAKIKAKKIIGKETKEDFWALNNINLDIKKGEVIGVIGKNGAGKSTLLKILTGITPPTTGEIKIKGRIASLLEVGTGFHPELTGRENIFLNGAILGMPRKEIVRKFDEIVAFSGIEKFIDTPVKRYSSGMYVRLAFSVAAHLEPDILLVDEVLAVGDAEFQKKCLGKMNEVTQSAGRTILFVSHNMGAIQKICKKCVLLENGSIKKYGETVPVIEEYLKGLNKDESELSKIFPFKAKQDIVINSFNVEQNSTPATFIDNDQEFQIKIAFEILNQIDRFRIGVYLKDGLGNTLTRSFSSDWKPEYEKIEKGKYMAVLNFPGKTLMPGNYTLMLHASRFGLISYLPEISKQITVSRPSLFNQNHVNEPIEAAFIVNKIWEFKKNAKNN